MPILNRAAEMQDEIAGWRRHIHRTPELGFDLHQTADFVGAPSNIAVWPSWPQACILPGTADA